MDVEERRQGAVTVVRPKGPLTGKEAGDFLGRLVRGIRESQGRLVLYVSAVPLMDSQGLQTLVRANDQMSAIGQTLKLCGENETIRQVLELTGVAGQLEHFE